MTEVQLQEIIIAGTEGCIAETAAESGWGRLEIYRFRCGHRLRGHARFLALLRVIGWVLVREDDLRQKLQEARDAGRREGLAVATRRSGL